jgi:hypothetical protein
MWQDGTTHCCWHFQTHYSLCPMMWQEGTCTRSLNAGTFKQQTVINCHNCHIQLQLTQSQALVLLSNDGTEWHAQQTAISCHTTAA